MRNPEGRLLRLTDVANLRDWASAGTVLQVVSLELPRTLLRTYAPTAISSMTPTMTGTPVFFNPAIGMRLSIHERRRTTATSSLGTRTEEARRRLHNINVLMKMHWQRPLRRSRDRRAIRMLVGRI